MLETILSYGLAPGEICIMEPSFEVSDFERFCLGSLPHLLPPHGENAIGECRRLLDGGLALVELLPLYEDEDEDDNAPRQWFERCRIYEDGIYYGSTCVFTKLADREAIKRTPEGKRLRWRT